MTGITRWTAPHADWKKDVESFAVDTADGRVFIDPLDPPTELGTPDHVLLTVFFHARSAGALDGARVWAPASLVRRLKNRGVEVTDPFAIGDELPGGIQAFETGREGEVLYWLPEQQALVVGDALLGSPFRLCPASWMRPAGHDDLRAALRPLLELPIESIYVGHGEPVLSGARDALAALVAAG
jgi:glyoxylase-like metal-dependent hydrolase (beta-lactamase superfamily II)